ncbi:hypothetical protein [Mycobacterium terramassiliense]|uniref:Uncharacterized protein n=1 Tax=Mycobacterium terramassiliense TaxID=1841859 RepID=A0A2U3NEV1_9MYCO|nr:hypothetical protein [Mycobacterium terramassiliense]SPM30029.1 hypothetical protein MTAB308_3528 [Mycobacterium terramassiliense]
MPRDRTRTAPPILALVAAARVGVGATMLLAPDRFFSPESGTETLLMQTIGIRDLVLGSGGCAAWLRGVDNEFRGWATIGLISDSADLLLGLRSKPLVGTRGALVATLAPVPFVGAGLFGLARRLRTA